jgi:hypothetical protein
MGIKIEVPYETVDSIILAGLKEQYKCCKAIAKSSTHAQDKEDYTNYCNAMKVIIKYYGG